jgi:transposase
MMRAWYFPSMPRIAPPMILSEPDVQELELWVAAHRTPQQVSQRCQIVLAAGRGQQDKAISWELGINFKTVALWRRRFLAEGPDCLWEVAAGRGRKPSLTSRKVKKIVNATIQTKPAGATHWSCRTMAKAQGGEQSHREPHLAEPPPPAAPDQEFQTLP